MPVRGGATIKARWPLPSGVSRSMTRVVIGSGPVSSRSQDSGLMGVSWSKVLTFAVLLGRHAVDVDDFPEPRPLLPAAGLDHAVDVQPLAEPELLDHAAGHEGIGQLAGVVGLGIAEEAVAVGVHFQHAAAGFQGTDFAVFLGSIAGAVADRRRSLRDA